MLPRVVLGESLTPDGQTITLAREAGALVVSVGGIVLMSSRMHGSEDELARVACEPLPKKKGVRVLVAGLGLGYTLRAALDALGPYARVVVSELLPCIIEWNRGPVGPLAGHPLEDPRVELVPGDLRDFLRRDAGRFDAILLDIDNGPEAFTVPTNAWLYGASGLAALGAALEPGGTVVTWSAFESARFERALRAAGFSVDVINVRGRGVVKKGAKHFLYVARRSRSTKPRTQRRV